ncbi:LLM class flavin-dependent oxidoreductase [Flavisphingomonas formosensis]|uniref:LLM class flavin-dependent oxidoreductase n=1 Tax=Flavisphingomonas formosensis TaxID=861534 RepID=UPI0012F75A88|nr:LLM class flavin-dependent oxidoreductase [Sphingomonas formosensis]
MTTRFSVMVTGALPMADYVPLARQVEAYGFSQIHIADDLVFRPAWPILTMIAMNTSRLQLGPFIVTPQVANPVYHAANLAALDELSGGRMVCGVGRGGFNPLLGITHPVRPIKMLKEAWQVMDRMLAGDRTPFDGEFFRATADLYFQFDVPRRIPLFIGTWGHKMARMAGGIAAGIKIDCTASPKHIAELRAEFLAGAAAAGRDPAGTEIIVGPLASIDEDRAAAEDRIRGMLALLQPFLAPMTTQAGIDEEQVNAAFAAFNAGDVERAKALVSDASIRAFSLTGTPHDVIGQIEEMIAAGADHIAFGPPTGPDPTRSLVLIGETILPHFGASVA